MPPYPLASRELASSGPHVGVVVGVVIAALLLGIVLGWLVLPRVKQFYVSHRPRRSLIVLLKGSEDRGQSSMDRKSFFDKDVFAVVPPPSDKKDPIVDVTPLTYGSEKKDSTESLNTQERPYESVPEYVLLPTPPSPIVVKSKSPELPRLIIPGASNSSKCSLIAVRTAGSDSPGSLYSEMSAATYLHQLVEMAELPPMPTPRARPSSMTLGKFLRAQKAQEEQERMEQGFHRVITISTSKSRPKGPRPVGSKSSCKRTKSRRIAQMETLDEDGKVGGKRDAPLEMDGESDRASIKTVSSLWLSTPSEVSTNDMHIMIREHLALVSPVEPLHIDKTRSSMSHV